jgi:hypothetical protein
MRDEAPALIYYALAPVISVPLTTVGAGMLGAAPGDQANAWLVRDGFKGLIHLIGICLFWVEIYILATIIAPFDLYPSLFWTLHILLIVIFALLMGGKISVSDEIYRGFWKGAVIALILSFFTVTIFREQVGVWWTQNMSNQTGRAIAEKQIEAASAGDKYYAEWVKKNVHTTDDGRLVVIVKGKDGNNKVVDAAPYIERAKRKGQEQKSHTTTGGTNAKKSGKASYFSYDYWKAKTFEWSKEWGWPIWIVAIIVIVTVLLHFIPFVWGLIWGAKKLSNNETATKKVVVEKKVSSSSSFAWRTPLVTLILLYLLISLFSGGWITPSDVSRMFTQSSHKAESVQTKVYPNHFMTPEEMQTWNAVGSFPDYHPNLGEIAGRSFAIGPGTRNGARSTFVDRFIEGGEWKPLLIKLEENNTARDVILKNTNCNLPLTYEDQEVHAVCTGTWKSGDDKIKGNYELIYSANNRIAKLYAIKPSGEKETIVFVFQPK